MHSQGEDIENVIILPEKMGELLVSARSFAGYASPEAAEHALAHQLGLRMPGGLLRQMEEGTAGPTFEQVCAIAYLYRLPGGITFFLAALRPPLDAELKRAEWPFPRRRRKER